MSESVNKKSKGSMSLPVRILIGLISLPSFALFCMVVATVLAGDHESIDLFEVVYSIVGIVGLYIALTGKRLF